MLHQDCIAKLLDMEHLEVNDMEQCRAKKNEPWLVPWLVLL